MRTIIRDAVAWFDSMEQHAQGPLQDRVVGHAGAVLMARYAGYVIAAPAVSLTIAKPLYSGGQDD